MKRRIARLSMSDKADAFSLLINGDVVMVAGGDLSVLIRSPALREV